jgi:hypothetical protein
VNKVEAQAWRDLHTPFPGEEPWGWCEICEQNWPCKPYRGWKKRLDLPGPVERVWRWLLRRPRPLCELCSRTSSTTTEICGVVVCWRCESLTPVLFRWAGPER